MLRVQRIRLTQGKQTPFKDSNEQAPKMSSIFPRDPVVHSEEKKEIKKADIYLAEPCSSRSEKDEHNLSL